MCSSFVWLRQSFGGPFYLEGRISSISLGVPPQRGRGTGNAAPIRGRGTVGGSGGGRGGAQSRPMEQPVKVRLCVHIFFQSCILFLSSSLCVFTGERFSPPLFLESFLPSMVCPTTLIGERGFAHPSSVHTHRLRMDEMCLME